MKTNERHISSTKRLISLLLAIILVATMVPALAFATGSEEPINAGNEQSTEAQEGMENPESSGGEGQTGSSASTPLFTTEEADLSEQQTASGLSTGASGHAPLSFPGTLETGDLSPLDAGDTWQVNFWVDALDPSPCHNETVEDGALATGPTDTPIDPTGVGTFVGWYADLADTTPVDLNTKPIHADVDFYAKFSTGALVQFRNVMGDILLANTLTDIATVGAISTLPTATEVGLSGGQTVEYWYLEGSDGTTDYLAANNAGTAISGVVTLLPKISGMYTVSFNTQGGTPLSPVNVVSGQPLGEPQDPTKNGYELLHWSLIPGGEAYNFSTAVTSSFTLYAVWGPATNVGFHLVYWASEYESNCAPEERKYFINRTTVAVTAEEDKRPVGSTLSNADIKALAQKYFSTAAPKGYTLDYIFTYYENPTDNKPNQAGALNASGNTVINVYYTPTLIDLTFDMTSSGGSIQVGSTNHQTYTITTNYQHAISALYPDSHKEWPYDEGVRTAEGSSGATVINNGKTLVGWEVVTPVHLAGKRFGQGISTGDGTFPASVSPYYLGPSFNTMTVKPIWADENDVVLLNYYRYSPVGYETLQAILANPSLATHYPDMTFMTGENARPQYILIDGGYYATPTTRYDYSLYLTRATLKGYLAQGTWNYILNGTTVDTTTQVNRYLFEKPVEYTATFNEGEGSWPEGTTQDQIVIKRQYQWPILMPGYEAPTPLAPTGMQFEGWYINSELTSKLNKNHKKDNSNEQTFFAKYIDLEPKITFYDAAVDGNQLGDAITVSYNQSFNDAGKSLPTSPKTGDVIEGKGEFNGWYYLQNGVEYEFQLNTPLTEESYTVYATYKQVQYTVTFCDENEDPTGETRLVWSDPTGAGKNTITLGGGINRRMPVLAPKSGSVAYWTTEPNGNGAIFTGSTQVSKDIRVYAYYDELITIKYETGVGGSGLTRTSETIAAKKGTALGAEISTVTGYEFDGWYTDVLKEGALQIFVPAKNTLTGKYEAATHTAKFKAIINYQSSNNSAGTVNPTQEKVAAGDDSAVQGSEAIDGIDAEFSYWLNSRGQKVSTERTYKPAATPETYTAVFVDPVYAVITYEVVKTNEQWGGSVSLPAESILKDTGDSAGSTATAYSGFVFDGWATSPGGTRISNDLYFKPAKPNGGVDPWASTTYYAHFREAGSVTIEYKVGEGRGTLLPAQESVLPLSGTAKGSTPTALPGYSFDKWTTDAAGANEALSAGAGNVFIPTKESVSGNEVYVARTYFAHFKENEVTITYEVGTAGGGTLDYDEDTVAAETGDENDLVGSTPTADDGYNFVGWARSADGSNPVDANWVDADDKLLPQKEDSGSLAPSYTIFKPATYYAIFAPNTYQIIYDSNGGSGTIDNEDVVFKSTYKTNDGSGFLLNGYTLTSWNTQANGKGMSYDLNTTEYTYTAIGNTKLFAQWEPNSGIAYHVEHYRVASGASPVLYERIKHTAKTDEEVTAAYKDYSGAGYSAAYTYAGTERVGKVLVDGSLVLKLFYTQNVYTVNFVDWNGAVLASRSVAHGGAALAPTNPSRLGYTFQGWDKAYTNVTSNLTVYARYTINTYTVTFVDWNGTVLSSQTVNFGGSATAPTNPTRSGYTFTGWSGSYTNVTSNVSVTAQYTPVETFTITFISYGNNVIQTSTVERGGSVTPPANPTRAGYTFTGWDQPSSAWTNVTADATITAAWNNETVATPVTEIETEDPGTPTPTQELISAAAEEQGIPSIGVPLAAPQGFAAWALANLILAVLGVVMALVFAILRNFRKNDDDDIKEREERRRQRVAQNAKTGTYGQADEDAEPLRRRRSIGWLLASLVLVIAGVVLFILTQDITLPMVWFDFWTIAQAALLVAAIVLGNIGIGRKKQKSNEEEDAAVQTA